MKYKGIIQNLALTHYTLRDIVESSVLGTYKFWYEWSLIGHFCTHLVTKEVWTLSKLRRESVEAR